MDIAPYLKRIGFTATPKPDQPTLEALQWQHLFHVPFEDIDVHYRISIKLDEASVFNKVVANNRGGYCYELNSLFAILLTTIGFDVCLLSARVRRGNTFGEEYDHMAILVSIDGEQWLTDVGFGHFSLKPLLLKENLVQNDGRDDYRIVAHGTIDGASYLAVERYKPSLKQFVAEYIFTLNKKAVADFIEKNEWQQLHPESHFVQNFICSKPTHTGRISIINHHFIHTDQSSKVQRVVNDDERKELLQSLFGIG